MSKRMNDNFLLSPQGLALIQAFESCLMPVKSGDPSSSPRVLPSASPRTGSIRDGSPKKFRAYICPAGKLTIGWGHTNDHGRSFDADTIWTQAECDAALHEDMAHFEAAVKRLVTIALNQAQFDALLSFAYNCGEGNLGKSTLLRKLNAGDFAAAALEFPRWNRGGGRVLPGLTRRRLSEALLFQGIPDNNYDGKPDVGGEPMAQLVDPPAPTAIAPPPDDARPAVPTT